MKDKFKKLKILTVVGTRPEIIRLSRVIDKLEKSNVIEHILVHTGQNYDYELNEIFFEELEIKKPKYFLEAAGDDATSTAGNILIKINPLLKKIKPDALLVLGDTNSCLCAIAAKKLQIPIFHMEAGNRCFDERVPEETNRKIVDHISDINLTYSDISRDYLLREGLCPDKVIKTGSPMLEVLNFNKSKIKNSNILNKLNLISEKYFLVSAHREENINSSNFEKLFNSLNLIANLYNLPIIVSTHPRTKHKINKSKIKLDPIIKLLKPLGYHDYNYLQINSKVVLSDSGTISEESSILNFPALNIREAHERPEAMEESSVMMVGLNENRIIQGIELLATQKRNSERTLFQVDDYSSSNVSEKVIRIILSYVDYVNSTVWKKTGF